MIIIGSSVKDTRRNNSERESVHQRIATSKTIMAKERNIGGGSDRRLRVDSQSSTAGKRTRMEEAMREEEVNYHVTSPEKGKEIIKILENEVRHLRRIILDNKIEEEVDWIIDMGKS